MERICQHNDAIICDSTECYHCGWDPEVAKKRAEDVRARMNSQTLYKVPFTGYCEVWASSPKEAADKADNDEMFFVHYDFGNPECLEKEGENEDQR